MLDNLWRHHSSHISTARWISYHSGTPADQGDWLISCHLQTLHQAERHKMSYMEAVCCRVKANIEYRLSLIYHFPDLFFVCYLGNKTSGN